MLTCQTIHGIIHGISHLFIYTDCWPSYFAWLSMSGVSMLSLFSCFVLSIMAPESLHMSASMSCLLNGSNPNSVTCSNTVYPLEPWTCLVWSHLAGVSSCGTPTPDTTICYYLTMVLPTNNNNFTAQWDWNRLNMYCNAIGTNVALPLELLQQERQLYY